MRHCEWNRCEKPGIITISTKISCECVEYHEIYDVCEKCSNIVLNQEPDSSCLDCKNIFEQELAGFDYI